MRLFLNIVDIVNSGKICLFFENEAACICGIMRKYFTRQISITQFIGNHAILFKCFLHKDKAVLRFTS